MATVVLPQGFAAVPAPFGVNEALLGARVASYRFDMFDHDENIMGFLEGVDPGSGSVQWSAYASIKSGGSINMTDIGVDIDWLNVRIRPVARIGAANYDGTDLEVKLGMFLPSAPVEDWSSIGRSWKVELLDKLSILDTDIGSSDPDGRVAFAAAAGSNIIDLVIGLIEGAGETAPAIEPDDKVLAGDQVWDLKDTRLKIINDLLDQAGYFSLYTDGAGQFRADPYVRPEDRVPVYESLNPFSKGQTSLMSPDWTRDRDIFAVPNRYILIGQGDGTTPGLVGVATNRLSTNPANSILDPDFSYEKRGERWITATEEGVEAIDQATIDSMALRRLVDATSVTQTMEVQHALLPDLAINKVVRFTNPDAELDAVRATVTNLEIPFDPTALCKSTLRVVAS